MAQSTIHLEPGPVTEAFRRASFPGYSGRKFTVTVRDYPFENFHSYWDGGSRDYWAVVELASMKAIAVPENGSGFIPELRGVIRAGLPSPGYAVVRHSIFCGKDSGLSIYLHPENAAAFLPAPVELTWSEKVVLVATRSLKAFARFDEAHYTTKISRADYDAAKASLIGRKLLNSAGAITVEGRNACPSADLYRLGKERA